MRERSSSVLYLIKHSYSRFKWLKNYPSDEFIGEVQVHVTPSERWGVGGGVGNRAVLSGNVSNFNDTAPSGKKICNSAKNY